MRMASSHMCGRVLSKKAACSSPQRPKTQPRVLRTRRPRIGQSLKDEVPENLGIVRARWVGGTASSTHRVEASWSRVVSLGSQLTRMRTRGADVIVGHLKEKLESQASIEKAPFRQVGHLASSALPRARVKRETLLPRALMPCAAPSRACGALSHASPTRPCVSSAM